MSRTAVSVPGCSMGCIRRGGAVRLRGIQSKPADNPFQQFAKGPENLGGLGAATTLSLDDAASIRGLKGIEGRVGRNA